MDSSKYMEANWWKLKPHQFLHIVQNHQVRSVGLALLLCLVPGDGGGGEQVAVSLERHPSFPACPW